MLGNWFDLQEIDVFAASLANEFVQRAPEDALRPGVRGSNKRLSDAQAVLLDRVNKFVSGRKLNFFKRASLANKLKWRLLESGYPKEIVDPFVLEIVKAASQKTR